MRMGRDDGARHMLLTPTMRAGKSWPLLNLDGDLPTPTQIACRFSTERLAVRRLHPWPTLSLILIGLVPAAL